MKDSVLFLSWHPSCHDASLIKQYNFSEPATSRQRRTWLAHALPDKPASPPTPAVAGSKQIIHAPPGHEDKLLLGNLLHKGYPLVILYVDCCWAFRFRCVRATAEPFKNFPVTPVFPSGSPTAHWVPGPLTTQNLLHSL